MTPEHFKKIRKNLGLNQQQLADTLELHANTISLIETGGTEIDKRAEFAMYWLSYAGQGDPTQKDWRPRHLLVD